MAMGIVSDDEFEIEIRNSGVDVVEAPTKTTVGVINELPSKGRQKNSTEVPDSLRQIIGETSHLESRTSALDLANRLGISPSSVSAYAKGATSTASYNIPSESITNHIIERKGKRAKTALSVMRNAMMSITPEKLQSANAKELSGVAKDMAAIVKQMEPEVQGEAGKQAPQFVVFAPSFRDERSFEVIHAKD